MDSTNTTIDSGNNQSTIDKASRARAIELEKRAKVEKILAEAEKQSKQNTSVFRNTNTQTIGIPKLFAFSEPVIEPQNPQQQFNIYYKIRKIVMKHLKGRTFADIRNAMNLYLKEGKRKGMEGKFAYSVRLVEVLQLLEKWEEDFGGTQPTILYRTFNDLLDKNAGLKDCTDIND